MKHCRSCNHQLLDGARFCAHCGAPIQAGTAQLVRPGDTRFLTAEDVQDLAAQRRVVTVLFTDISGYTSMSERLDPEVVVDILNSFFRVLTEPIYRYGGIVDKYIGDAIMALFGAPVAHEDDAERALRAAWEMQQAAQAFSDRLSERTGISLKVRIGISTGLVVAGEVGGLGHRDYSVLGDTVNLAQRMEAAAKPGTVLVASETRRQGGAGFTFSEMPPILVKGKTLSVGCFELLGLAAMGQAAGSLLAGRHRERAVLEEAWQEAKDGKPGLVTLIGEAGAGKTAITDAFLAGLAPQWRGVRTSCSSYDRNVPAGMAGRILAELLHVHPGLHQGARLDHRTLHAALARVSPTKSADPEAEAMLGVLLGLELPVHLSGLPPEHRASLAFRHLNDLLIECARWEPLAVVCEGIQWSDELSLQWLGTLQQQVAGHDGIGLLLVVTSRPGESAPAASGMVARVLDLGPMDAREARELLAAKLGDESLAGMPEDLVRRLLERGGGNPAFLSALAETVAAQLAASPNTLPDLAALPVSIVAHLSARLDSMDLSRPTLNMLETAAILGPQLDRVHLAALHPEAAVEESLRELAEKGALLRDPTAPDRLSFAHPLLQEVLYERVLIQRRRTLHTLVAQLLARLREHPAVVAEHYARAGMAPAAADHLAKAAQTALACFANKDALELATRAEDWLRRIDAAKLDPGMPDLLGRIRVGALAALGRLDEAVTASVGLLERASHPTGIAEAYEHHAGLLIRQGRLQEALAACDEGTDKLNGKRMVAEALSDQAGSEPATGAACRLAARRAQVRMKLGDLKGAYEGCRTALAELNPGDAESRGFGNYTMGSICHRLNDATAARLAYERALGDYQEIGDLYHMAHTLSDLGVVLVGQGAESEGAERFDQAMELALRIGDRRLVGILYSNLALLAFNDNRPDDALGFTARSLEVYRAIKDDFSIALALHNLGEICLTVGQPGRAQPYLSECVDLAETIGAKEVLGFALRHLASVHVARCEWPDALALLQRCLQVSHDTNQAELEGITMRMVSEVLVHQGRDDDAVSWAARSIQVLDRIDTLSEQGRAYAHLGRLLQDQGRSKQASEAFEQALTRFGRLGARKEIEEIQAFVGR